MANIYSLQDNNQNDFPPDLEAGENIEAEQTQHHEVINYNVREEIREALEEIFNRNLTVDSRLHNWARRCLGTPYNMIVVSYLYGFNQSYMLYNSALVTASIFSNPRIEYFGIGLLLFVFKILWESHLDSFFRKRFNYKSRVSTDVTLALFFISLFGIIYKFKSDAGVFNEPWFTSFMALFFEQGIQEK